MKGLIDSDDRLMLLTALSELDGTRALGELSKLTGKLADRLLVMIGGDRLDSTEDTAEDGTRLLLEGTELAMTLDGKLLGPDDTLDTTLEGAALVNRLLVREDGSEDGAEVSDETNAEDVTTDDRLVIDDTLLAALLTKDELLNATLLADGDALAISDDTRLEAADETADDDVGDDTELGPMLSEDGDIERDRERDTELKDETELGDDSIAELTGAIADDTEDTELTELGLLKLVNRLDGADDGSPRDSDELRELLDDAIGSTDDTMSDDDLDGLLDELDGLIDEGTTEDVTNAEEDRLDDSDALLTDTLETGDTLETDRLLLDTLGNALRLDTDVLKLLLETLGIEVLRLETVLLLETDVTDADVTDAVLDIDDAAAVLYVAITADHCTAATVAVTEIDGLNPLKVAAVIEHCETPSSFGPPE